MANPISKVYSLEEMLSLIQRGNLSPANSKPLVVLSKLNNTCLSSVPLFMRVAVCAMTCKNSVSFLKPSAASKKPR